MGTRKEGTIKQDAAEDLFDLVTDAIWKVGSEKGLSFIEVAGALDAAKMSLYEHLNSREEEKSDD